MNAEQARKASILGLEKIKRDQLQSILDHIKEQAKFGSTGIQESTVYDLESDTVAELNRRGFAVYIKPRGDGYEPVGRTIYVSWGIAGVVPLWVPDWLSKAETHV